MAVHRDGTFDMAPGRERARFSIRLEGPGPTAACFVKCELRYGQGGLVLPPPGGGPNQQAVTQTPQTFNFEWPRADYANESVAAGSSVSLVFTVYHDEGAVPNPMGPQPGRLETTIEEITIHGRVRAH